MTMDVREMGIWLHKILAENDELYIPHVLEEKLICHDSPLGKGWNNIEIDKIKLDTFRKTTSRQTTSILLHY